MSTRDDDRARTTLIGPYEREQGYLVLQTCTEHGNVWVDGIVPVGDVIEALMGDAVTASMVVMAALSQIGKVVSAQMIGTDL